MTALALSPSTPHQDIPDPSRIAPMLMTSDQVADYCHRSLRINFGRRKLSAARSGLCEGPPVFLWLGNVPLYWKTQIDSWARREYPHKTLIDPWRDRDEG